MIFNSSSSTACQKLNRQLVKIPRHGFILEKYKLPLRIHCDVDRFLLLKSDRQRTQYVSLCTFANRTLYSENGNSFT